VNAKKPSILLLKEQSGRFKPSNHTNGSEGKALTVLLNAKRFIPATLRVQSRYVSRTDLLVLVKKMVDLQRAIDAAPTPAAKGE
jgi:hypothetical protein